MKTAKRRKLIRVLDHLIPLLEKCGGPGSGVPGPCPSGNKPSTTSSHSPPKPESISSTAKDVTSKPSIPHIEKKIGEWATKGQDVSFSGAPSGKQYDEETKAKMWTEGERFAKSKGLQADVKDYTGTGYEPINVSLRSGRNLNHDRPKSGLKIAEAIVKHGPILPEGGILTREHYGVKFDEWSKVAPGTILSDRGLLSTTTDNKELKVSHRTKLIMTVGAGVRGLPAKSMSDHPSENEVILGPNQRMVITKIERATGGKDGSTEVHATILPTLDSQCCPP